MIYVFVFIFGACFGSFALVLGERLPINKNAVNSHSECDNCHHILSWWELIPILSYIFLLGKCRHCHKRISIINPLMEIALGSLFVYSYYMFDISYNFFTFCIIATLMLIIFVSDFTYYIINDSPLVVSSVMIFMLQIIYFGWKYALIHLMSGIVLFAIMYLIKIIGDVLFKKESLGGGDIKFAFVVGLTTGIQIGLCSLILSTFLALPYSMASIMLKKNNEVPYGPFLAASLFITFLFMDKFQSLLDLIIISV